MQSPAMVSAEGTVASDTWSLSSAASSAGGAVMWWLATLACDAAAPHAAAASIARWREASKRSCASSLDNGRRMLRGIDGLLLQARSADDQRQEQVANG